MSKEIYISSTPHETRLAIVENDALTEIYYERENEYTLAGSIYNGKVTRVLPGMQSSFVDIGLDRDAFLYITDFMEEAGDAADFESNANGSEGRRAPRDGVRPDNGRGDNNRRGDRGDRGSRDSQPRIAPAEPTDSELFTEAVSGLDPARPVSDSERGGSRRGGRNRRDRNSDGTPRRERVQDHVPDRSSGNRADGPSFDAPVPILAEPPSAEDSLDVGEGAPGADGSRRWRGRRGRRGSRPDSGGQEAPREVAAQPIAPSSQPTGPVYNAYPADDAFEVFETPFAAPSATEERTPRVDGEARGDRNDRGERNDRGGRGDRNRGPRRDREDRAPQAPRAPRGFAPSTSLYQVEGSAEPAPYGQDAYEAAPAEPIILPGESLSKYRPGNSEAAASTAAPTATPAPATEFIAAGWDGGMVLPGETIRPRGPRTESGSGNESRRDSSPREDRGGRGDRGGRDSRDDRNRNDRGGRNNRNDRPSQPLDRGPRPDRGTGAPNLPQPRREERAQAASAAAAPLQQTTAEPIIEAPAHHTPSEADTSIHSTFVPPPPRPDEHLPAAAASIAAEPASDREYEPSEASASYRVDPAAPSEFRQSAPVMEDEVRQEARPELMAEEAPGSADHQVTAISPTGDMHSEAPDLLSQEPTTHERTQELTAPAPSAQGGPESTEPLTAEVTAADQTLPYFAPGTGLLEEEEMLEDEDDAQPEQIATLHAHGEHDQHEQETLEGAADLGSMIREMSIDRTTRREPALDEQDDEDDFLEEDQDFEESDSEESEDSDEPEDGEDEAEFASRESSERDGEGENQDESARELEESPYGSAFESEPVIGEGFAPVSTETREPRRDGRSGERSSSPDRGRRDGRRGDRGRRPGSGDRDRGSSSGDRDRGRDRGRGRQTMQSTNLPAISDLLKPGQEVLVQIAKEPIAKKGARITSHIALPGRFLVFMPTVHHTGVSRKIESDAERRRLKEILLSEKGEAAGGFIVRTAASGASEEELRSDLRFLLNLWSDIKNRSEGSKSPALIYHDLNLVERVLRDQVTDTFSAIWVDTETEYERVLRFLQRFQPSLIRRVKLYTKEVPLFEQFGITEEINKALRSKVWLKSGGSIVINQTEALVAIDINTGKFVGKTARLEDTIVKTNLDAIPEIVRQIRLRDLGGIIIIDFIDMDDRKNRNRVMAALEDELKSDRAPSKVLQFNDFGLVAITRKRVKQSLERTLSTTCGICQGTGMVKSPVTVCNDIYIEMRKMNKHLERGDVMLRVHPDVVKQLKSTTSRWLQEMEEMVGKTILVKSDPSLHPEQFDLH